MEKKHFKKKKGQGKAGTPGRTKCRGCKRRGVKDKSGSGRIETFKKQTLRRSKAFETRRGKTTYSTGRQDERPWVKLTGTKFGVWTLK